MMNKSRLRATRPQYKQAERGCFGMARESPHVQCLLPNEARAKKARNGVGEIQAVKDKEMQQLLDRLS